MPPPAEGGAGGGRGRRAPDREPQPVLLSSCDLHRWRSVALEEARRCLRMQQTCGRGGGRGAGGESRGRCSSTLFQ